MCATLVSHGLKTAAVLQMYPQYIATELGLGVTIPQARNCTTRKGMLLEEMESGVAHGSVLTPHLFPTVLL